LAERYDQWAGDYDADLERDFGYKGPQAALESAGKWRLVEVSDKFQALPKGEPDIYHPIWVY